MWSKAKNIYCKLKTNINHLLQIFKLRQGQEKKEEKIKVPDSDKYANNIFIQVQGQAMAQSKKEVPSQKETSFHKLQTEVKIPEQNIQELKPIKTIYIPCYLRAKIKNFTRLNLTQLSAQMNCTLIFSVYYGELNDILDVQKQLMERIVFNFNRNQALQLAEKLQIVRTIKQNQKTFQYTVRKYFNMRIDSDIFWSPFQIIKLILTVTIQKLKVTLKNGMECQVKFNLMDHQSSFVKLSYSEEGTFGLYDLAQSLLLMEPSNDAINSQSKKQNQEKQEQQKALRRFKKFKNKQQQQQYIKKQKQKLKQKKQNQRQNSKFKNNYQYGHFIIPLYKFPVTSLITVFIPLVLLGILNLGVFFQDTSLSDRIASIAGLMIAFVALIPIIRQQTPPSPQITFIEILVIIQACSSILCFFKSINVRGIDPDQYEFVWYTDIVYIIALLLLIFSILIVAAMYIIHKYKWQLDYNRYISEEKESKFNHKEWFNKTCSQQLMREKQQIIPIKQFKDLEKYKPKQVESPVRKVSRSITKKERGERKQEESPLKITLTDSYVYDQKKQGSQQQKQEQRKEEQNRQKQQQQKQQQRREQQKRQQQRKEQQNRQRQQQQKQQQRREQQKRQQQRKEQQNRQRQQQQKQQQRREQQKRQQQRKEQQNRQRQQQQKQQQRREQQKRQQQRKEQQNRQRQQQQKQQQRREQQKRQQQRKEQQNRQRQQQQKQQQRREQQKRQQQRKEQQNRQRQQQQKQQQRREQQKRQQQRKEQQNRQRQQQQKQQQRREQQKRQQQRKEQQNRQRQQQQKQQQRREQQKRQQQRKEQQNRQRQQQQKQQQRREQQKRQQQRKEQQNRQRQQQQKQQQRREQQKRQQQRKEQQNRQRQQQQKQQQRREQQKRQQQRKEQQNRQRQQQQKQQQRKEQQKRQQQRKEQQNRQKQQQQKQQQRKQQIYIQKPLKVPYTQIQKLQTQTNNNLWFNEKLKTQQINENNQNIQNKKQHIKLNQQVESKQQKVQQLFTTYGSQGPVNN